MVRENWRTLVLVALFLAMMGFRGSCYVGALTASGAEHQCCAQEGALSVAQDPCCDEFSPSYHDLTPVYCPFIVETVPVQLTLESRPVFQEGAFERPPPKDPALTDVITPRAPPFFFG